jgi:transcriptional regulator GlxA family with amidase domain
MAAWIREAAPRARRVVSVCAGALVLSRAGLLDGLEATTHWLALDELERSYPLVRERRGPIYVRTGKLWTSAGASSGFDLALALVEEDMGHAVAKAVAQYLVMHLQRPDDQSQFSALLAAQASAEGPVGKIQAWVLEHLLEDLGVERLAERAAMSPRNFSRVFALQTGTTPARYVEAARLEEARRRLESGRESLGEVAATCGLGGDLGLRRLFARNLGVNPGEYRERFGRI